MKEPEKEKPCRFTKLNFYSNLDSDDDDDSASSNEMEDNESDSELEKPFDETLKRHEKIGPTKKGTKNGLKSIQPSSGFKGSLKNKPAETTVDESASSKKGVRKRTKRVLFDPALKTDESGDKTNLHPDIAEFDQLMSCLEQDVKAEVLTLTLPLLVCLSN